MIGGDRVHTVYWSKQNEVAYRIQGRSEAVSLCRGWGGGEYKRCKSTQGGRASYQKPFAPLTDYDRVVLLTLHVTMPTYPESFTEVLEATQ